MKKLAMLLGVLIAMSTQSFGEPDGSRSFQKLLGKLELTKEQRDDVDKIQVAMQKQMIAQKAKIAAARVDLQQLFKADSPDKSAIEKKIKEIADLGTEMRMIRINSWFAINKLLIPEQQKAWKKVLEDRPGMRQSGMKDMEKGPMMRHHKQMMSPQKGEPEPEQ